MYRIAALGLALAAAPLTIDELQTIKRTETEYRAAVAAAEGRLADARREAEQKRLKVYNAELQKATREGDFDRATALKARIEQYERQGFRRGPEKRAEFGGHEYALIAGPPETWHVAVRRCEQMGGHLVCCETPAELAFVKTLCGEASAWLGASDEEQEGVWTWVNGTPIEEAMFKDVKKTPGRDDYHWLNWWAPGPYIADGPSGYRQAYVCEWK